MNIIFMGTPEFAISPLKQLINAKHNIKLVITQPDRKGNRGKINISKVKELALEKNLEIEQPYGLKGNDELVKKIKDKKPDIIVVVAYGRLIPKEILEIPKYGCINIHGSLLPKLRGAAPMQYAILEGYKTTGVTIMQLDEGLDTGMIIKKGEIQVGNKDINELSEELSTLGGRLLLESISEIEEGNAIFEEQNHNEATFSKIIKKQDGETFFNEPAQSIERKLRAFKVWPGLYSYINGKRIKIIDGKVINEQKGEIGTVVSINKKSFEVGCKDSTFEILKIQPEGKKPMDVSEFLKGNKIEKGMKFMRR